MILLYNYSDFLHKDFVSESEEFFSKVLNKKYDILVINFDFYKDLMEVRNYIKGYIIFFAEYIDEVVYKKALEVGDFCYDYNEIYKLNLRIKYLEKKILKLNSSIFKFNDLLFNFNTKELYKNKQNIKLTQAENELLQTLIKNRDRYIDKLEILDECENIGSIDSIKVLIANLRKLGFVINNKKNLGYKLEVENEKIN
jgi:DNA-binding response OmpR family regulator